MIELLFNALGSCFPLIILGIIIILLSWKCRGRIELMEIGANGFKVQFGKSGKLR